MLIACVAGARKGPLQLLKAACTKHSANVPARQCSTARRHLAGSPRLVDAYDTLARMDPGHGGAGTMRSFSAASLLPGSMRFKVDGSHFGATLALGIAAGVAVYYFSTAKSRAIPSEVRERCQTAHVHLSSGAPMNAAYELEQAEKLLVSSQGEPVVLLEVLFQLGDAQADAGMASAAYDSFSRAQKLCSSMIKLKRPEELEANHIFTKLAICWDRLATIAEKMSKPGLAQEHANQAVAVAETHYKDLLWSVQHFDPSTMKAWTVATRHTFADLAGLYFNSAHLRLNIHQEELTPDMLASITRHAEQAVLLVSAAKTSALHAAALACRKPGLTPTAGKASRAVGLRSAWYKDQGSRGDDVARATALVTSLQAQEALEPTESIASALPNVELNTELRALWGLEKAAVNLLQEVLRLNHAHAAPVASGITAS
jgi:hypothetical protein